MNLEFNHVFILVGNGTKEIELFGKQEYRQVILGKHGGQGTSTNLCFFKHSY